MIKLKYIYYSSIIFLLSTSSVLSGVTQGSPSNIISRIAKSTSFTSTAQSTPQAQAQTQNRTSTVINSAEIRQSVEDDAAAFGLEINETALAVLTGDATSSSEEEGQVFVTLNNDEAEPPPKPISIAGPPKTINFEPTGTSFLNACSVFIFPRPPASIIGL